MPLYVFECPAGHVTEEVRPVDQASDSTTCEQCGQLAARQYRLRGIGFKGAGFHNTDYPRGRRLRD